MKDSYFKACEENNLSLVRELLSKGADVNWRTDDDDDGWRGGWAGLHFAAHHYSRADESMSISGTITTEHL